MGDWWDSFWDDDDKDAAASAGDSNGNGVQPPPRNTAGGGDHESAYVGAALAAEENAVLSAPEGRRNDQLNVSTFNIGQLSPRYIAEAEVVERFVAVGLAAGLQRGEVHATVRSGVNAGMKKPRVIPDRPEPEPIPKVHVLADLPEDELAAVSAAIRERVPRIDWHELWLAEDEDEWIVEPLIPARRLVALFSAPKVGKSLLMLELAVAISQGSDVLGVPTAQARVLYVDFENDPRGDIRTRLQAMGHKPADLDDLVYLSYPQLAKLDSATGGAELVAVAAEYGCTVIIIDTISRAVAGEENDNDTWLSFYRNTGVLLKAAGIACVRLDHTGKDAEKGMRGGSAKYGDVDVVWKLAKVTDDTYRLDCEANRLPIHEKTIVVKRMTLPHLRHQVQAEGRMAAWSARVEATIKALDALGAPRDIKRRGAAALLRETGNRAGSDTIDRAIEARAMRLGGQP